MIEHGIEFGYAQFLHPRTLTCTPMSFFSSPDARIRRTMLQPPMNYPSMKSYGIVGHSENALNPSRTSGELSTSTVSQLGCSSSSIFTTWAENQHCDIWRVPFMKRTIRFCARNLEICFWRGSFRDMAVPFWLVVVLSRLSA